MEKIAIIADDLTGASDTALQFARQGLQTTVLFRADDLFGGDAGVAAIALDMDSRALSIPDSRVRAWETGSRIKEAGFHRVYTHVDSGLRGKIGPVIDGVLDAIPFEFAAIAPANPRLGHTTKDGRQHLNGVPVGQSESDRASGSPVAEAEIVRLLAGQSGRKAGLVSLEQVRAGADAIMGQVRSLLAERVKHVIFDAETDDDLRNIAWALAGSGRKPLYVGSAGLAQHLPEALGLMRGVTPPPEPIPATQKPVLTVVGSLSPAIRAQVAALLREPGVVGVEMDPAGVLRPADADFEAQRCLSILAAALSAGRDAVLMSSASPDRMAAARASGAELQLDAQAVSGAVADALGMIAAATVTHGDLGGVIMAGDDTARAVCRQLGVSGIRLLREAEPGVALGRLAGGPELPVAAIAGAPGPEATLARTLQMLKRGV